MTSISSLLNLGNSDYQNSLARKTSEDEEKQAAAREKLAQEKLEQQALAQQLRENAENQQAVRRLQQVDQEIQKLSLQQAQMMLQTLTKKIMASSTMQLQQAQSAGGRGILPPAYI